MAIEAAIGELDRQSGFALKDDAPIHIYERLIDRYHFGEESAAVEDVWEERGLLQLEGVIKGELHGIDRTMLVKVLGVLRFVARRRTRGRREYPRVVQTFVGGF